jgi:hypothetical protein
MAPLIGEAMNHSVPIGSEGNFLSNRSQLDVAFVARNAAISRSEVFLGKPDNLVLNQNRL